MSTVTVNIDHIPTEPITEPKWVDIATSLLHSDERAIHTRRDDVASLLMDNWRLERELEQAREDMSARWENSDHLAAKYFGRMQAAQRRAERAEAALARLVDDSMATRLWGSLDKEVADRVLDEIRAVAANTNSKEHTA